MSLFREGNRALLIAGACVVIPFLALAWVTISTPERPRYSDNPPVLPAWPVRGSTIAATQGARFSITDLGALDSTKDTEALAINDAGRVVGESGARPFLWVNGEMTELKGIENTSNWPALYRPSVDAAAQGINAKGQVAGWFAIWDEETEPGDVPNGYDTPHAFIWRRGKMIDRDPPGGNWGSGVYALNDRGELAGDANLHGETHHATFWDREGVAHDLGALHGGIWGTDNSQALAMNDTGEVVGSSGGTIDWVGGLDIVGATGKEAFLWRGKRMYDLGPGQADAINKSGEIAGESKERACVWVHRRRRYLPIPAGCATSTALGLNRWGDLVGFAGGHAILWKNGRWVDLNKEIARGSGWTLSMATGINSRDEIVGYGLRDGRVRAFLLVPVHQEKR